jgi:hypothetical protein
VRSVEQLVLELTSTPTPTVVAVLVVGAQDL